MIGISLPARAAATAWLGFLYYQTASGRRLDKANGGVPCHQRHVLRVYDAALAAWREVGSSCLWRVKKPGKKPL